MHKVTLAKAEAVELSQSCGSSLPPNQSRHHDVARVVRYRTVATLERASPGLPSSVEAEVAVQTVATVNHRSAAIRRSDVHLVSDRDPGSRPWQART
eukprot:753656-Hanusia_phi.AAC.15